MNHLLAALVRLKTTGFCLGSDLVPFGLSTYWVSNAREKRGCRTHTLSRD